MFGTTVGLSAAAGPVIGGLILAAFGPDQGWRYLFFVNVPIGLVAMVLAARLLPHAEPPEGTVRSQIDGVGALLLGATYFCGFSGIWLVLALYLQEGLGFTPPAVRADRDAFRDRTGRPGRRLPAHPLVRGHRIVIVARSMLWSDGRTPCTRRVRGLKLRTTLNSFTRR